jgi:hypothetical protein
MVLTMGEARRPSNQEGRPSQSLGAGGRVSDGLRQSPLHGGRRPRVAGLGRERSASEARGGGISTLVRAGSARHLEPLVLGRHERSRPASSDRRSQAVRPYDLGRPSSAGQGFESHLHLDPACPAAANPRPPHPRSRVLASARIAPRRPPAALDPGWGSPAGSVPATGQAGRALSMPSSASTRGA